MVGISSLGTNLFSAQSLKAAPKTESVTTAKSATGDDLSESEQKQVQELKKIDQEVKAHEQAHASVGGPYAGSPQYQYTKGPDGNRYAVSGEVPIDASAIANNPDATIRKMDIVIRAALAPAEPSAQDKQVAQQAQATRLQAQIEKRELQEREQSAQTGDENSTISAITSSNPLEALIQAAQDFSKSQNELNNPNAPSPQRLQNAIGSYNNASLLQAERNSTAVEVSA